MGSTSRLGDICDIQSGGTPPRSQSDYYGGLIPWAKISDLETADGMVANTEEQITEAGLAAIRGRLFPKGTLLFAMYGSIGKMAFAGRDLATNQAILGIQATDLTRVNPRYLYHWLNANKARLIRDGQGITQKNLSATYLRDLLVPLPPLDEQQRIVAILDQVDDLRRKQYHAFELLRSIGRSVFVETFGAGDGSSKGWPAVPFGDLVKDTKIGLVRGSATFGVGMSYPYIRMNAITRDQEIDFSTIMTTEASEVEAHEYSLIPGDFLFNTRNSKDLVGKSAIWPGPGNSLFNNNIMRVRFKESVEPAYILAAFRDPRALQELENRKSGTTSVFAIYWQQLKTLPIPLPPIEMQKTFAKRALEIDALKVLHRRRGAKLEQLFASVQHRAFEGTLTLSALEGPLASV